MNKANKNFLRISDVKIRDEIDLSEIEFVYEEGKKGKKVVLGKGSFASVYLIRHKRTFQLFALKVVY